MKHNLYIMCGAPGSGKSTWIRKHVKEPYVISRDAIRFSMITDEDDYFGKEKEVFKTFIRYIQESIDSDETPIDIYADATHITKASRDKVLNALDLSNVDNITVVVVRPSLAETLRRNNKRSGLARVPASAIRRMWFQFERPEEDENKIFDVKYVEVPE